jgi:hypothetical protein
MITRITDHPDLLDLLRKLPVQHCATSEAQRTLLAEGLVRVVVERALFDSDDEDQYLIVPTERGVRVIANPEAAHFG